MCVYFFKDFYEYTKISANSRVSSGCRFMETLCQLGGANSGELKQEDPGNRVSKFEDHEN